jgi:hypothetical protein
VKLKQTKELRVDKLLEERGKRRNKIVVRRIVNKCRTRDNKLWVCV